jgi:hypothetical protein
MARELCEINRGNQQVSRDPGAFVARETIRAYFVVSFARHHSGRTANGTFFSFGLLAGFINHRIALLFR